MENSLGRAEQWGLPLLWDRLQLQLWMSCLVAAVESGLLPNSIQVANVEILGLAGG